jgi:branched-chain amino acid transport system ATP-binding protein
MAGMKDRVWGRAPKPEAETGSVLLEARELSAGYHGNPVVRNLNLSVSAGQVVTLLGANGAGKSTTLLTLVGELDALGGEVVFLGKPTNAPLHLRARAGLAFVPEHRALFTRHTARDNLRVAGCDIDHALGLFPELEPLLPRLAGQLSGGEQQMLAIARALGNSPRVVLIDEMSLGLAPKIVARLLQALRHAADVDGVGVLLVEQHVYQALEVADQVYVLKRGEVSLSGSAAELGPKIKQAYLSQEGL